MTRVSIYGYSSRGTTSTDCLLVFVDGSMVLGKIQSELIGTVRKLDPSQSYRPRASLVAAGNTWAV